MRDLRHKEKYVIDDEYLNEYAKLCGWQGTIVYNSLCRHADRDQFSFPSLTKMANQHGVSTPTIIKGIKALEEWGLIEVDRLKHKSPKRKKGGTWRANGYTLTDKSQWKRSKPDLVGGESTYATSFTPPSKRRLLHLVNVVDSKDTHRKDTHNKETHTSDQRSRSVSFVLNEMKRIDPKNKMYWGNKTQRKACEFLVEEYGEKGIQNAVDFYLFAKKKKLKHRPLITTPVQLMEKWSSLADLIERKQADREKEKENFVE